MSGFGHRSACSVSSGGRKVVTEGSPYTREDVWTAQDFPAKIDQDFPITYIQYQSLKQRLIGSRVGPRDPRITDELLKSWKIRSWKQYVLEEHLGNF